MKPLSELINIDEPGMQLVYAWLAEGTLDYQILPASTDSGGRLEETQVTTRSPMGAIVYETGGILVDGGWLRILGSGCDRMQRSLPEWNRDVLGENRSAYLVADDVLGGFFAINGGALGEDVGSLYYFPYDDLSWQALEMNYSQFIAWCVTDGLHEFYGEDRFPDWEERESSISPDQCFLFYPFLWAAEGSVARSHCKPVPALETFHLKVEMINQLGEQTPEAKGEGK
ncbi:MAG: DUF2625 family protein [Verrucomicrobiota bacterium]